MTSTTHRWRFFRAGGVDQVLLETGEDLLALDELDPKLWVALACPVTSIEFDPRSARLLDADGDGRIRVSDLVEAVRWLRPRLADPADLIGGKSELSLSSFNGATPEGRALAEAARSALESLGKSGVERVSVEDAGAALTAFHGMPFNGDGVVTPSSAEGDAELATAISELVAVTGGAKDRGGELGLDEKLLGAFFDDAQAFVAWARRGDEEPELKPLGAATREGFELLAALAAKLDDFFARARLAAFDPRATAALNRDEKELSALAGGALSADAREWSGLPLAQVAPGRALPLREGLNPAWAEKVERLRERVVVPLLGDRDELAREDWLELRARFAPYEAWLAGRSPGLAEKLPRPRVEALVNGDFRARLGALVRKDAALAPVDEGLASLERLLYLVRDLHRFANNFVNFRDFYSRRALATFQAGTLYLDQRSCELCLKVEPGGAHATMAALSRTCLAYCDCVRRGSGEKMSIVAAFTAGDSDNLMVGRNGIFYDRRGREWDATVTRLVDNPISIRQAFWSPYKKLIRFVEEQVAKRAADKDEAATASLAAGAAEVVHAGEGKGPAKKPGFDVGVVAALGVAVGGITAALGALLHSIFGLGLWMPAGFLALLFAVSGPSMLIAHLKLRQRNLGPLLDANGWAVNTLARINVPFGGALTKTAALPPGSTRDLADPFPEKRQPWKTYAAVGLLLAASVAWLLGRFDSWLPERARAATLLGWKTEAPASPSSALPPAGREASTGEP